MQPAKLLKLMSVCAVGAWVPASAQTLPVASPSALANYVAQKGMPTIYGFRVPRVVCGPGGSAPYAYACGGNVIDSSRPGKESTVIITMYDGRADFAGQASFLGRRVDASPNRWKIHNVQDFAFTVRGRRIALKASCHQALGVRNGPASCALPIAANVVVVATVAARRPSTDRIGANGGGTFDDVQDATALLAAGAVPVAEFILGAAAPPPRSARCEGSDPIFRKKGC